MPMSRWTRRLSVITLIGFLSVGLSESLQHSLVRRQDTSRQQCGIGFGVEGLGPDITCINYNGDPYTCRTLDCYIGDPNSRPDLPPYPLLLFKNCRKMLSDYNLGPPINQTHPIWYHADNQAQTLEAQIDGSGDKYLCTWTESTDPNNVRPYCDGCSSADTENSQP
ncbi:hypothetical protein PGT21_007710 [Puccinia graminis f. sp. tritici]|uniref:Secreted protein n=1 Tax=Puccinia graminis f. sp. tritici TaxID=56615 RepID=A0A5B0Q596_PUCGR|nr:hypothetical protein PGT21_007710 [Puccinia graminis f. sp. tritici]